MTSNGSYIKSLMTEIAACVCAELEELGRPTCFCGIIPGSRVIPDYLANCENSADGIAWVRMAVAYPAYQPGIPIDSPAESATAGLGYDIEVGVLRAYVSDAEGPTEAEAADAATFQTDDMLAIRRAIQCCVALERADFILGQYAPLGPDGFIAGGAWTVMVHRP